MKRIVIVGSGGSGKSTLALQIGLILGLDVVYLDRLFWVPGWIRFPVPQQDAIIDEIISRPNWIIEGDHIRTQPLRFAASDTIVFLDFPRSICLWRTLKRFLLNRGKSRLGMADGCPEQLNWGLLRWVWRYPADNRSKVIKNIEQFEAGRTMIILDCPTAVKRFLANLTHVEHSGSK